MQINGKNYEESKKEMNKLEYEFDVHETVHRDNFLIIEQTRCTNFSNLFLY